MDKVIGNVDKYFKLIVIGILSIQLLVSVIALNTFNGLTIQAYQKGVNGTFLKTYDRNIADAVHFNTGAIRVLKQEWD